MKYNLICCFAVEELKIANVSGSDMSCETDWLAMESCVPSGGSRMCGDLSGTSGEPILLSSSIMLSSSRVVTVINVDDGMDIESVAVRSIFQVKLVS
jgi:hypothetical protein